MADVMLTFICPLCSVLLFGVGHQLKLCDFGTATKIEHTLTNGVGTVRYMAPEVIKGTVCTYTPLYTGILS